jgi:preprotein translocase subunit SecA
MNQQREVIYKERKRVLNGENLKDSFIKMIDDTIASILHIYCSESNNADYWDWNGIINYAENVFLPKDSFTVDSKEIEMMNKEALSERLSELAKARYEEKEAEIGSELMRELERVALLRSVDTKWIDHIDAMDQLREGITLRAYGQQDPVQAYQIEGYDMFVELIKNIKEDTVRFIYNVNTSNLPRREKVAEPIMTNEDAGVKKPVVKGEKIGRNDPCPCGSGKKYKKCCGAEKN